MIEYDDNDNDKIMMKFFKVKDLETMRFSMPKKHEIT